MEFLDQHQFAPIIPNFRVESRGERVTKGARNGGKLKLLLCFEIAPITFYLADLNVVYECRLHNTSKYLRAKERKYGENVFLFENLMRYGKKSVYVCAHFFLLEILNYT